MSCKFSSYALMWFMANAAYYHVFFLRFPREEIRIGVPALAIFTNIPITILMMVNTTSSLKKAQNLGFYYMVLMFFVFLLVGLFIAARIPTRYICDDSPSFCGRHPTRETFLAFVNGLEMFFVFSGVIFLELLRYHMISSQIDAIIAKHLKGIDVEEGEFDHWM